MFLLSKCFICSKVDASLFVCRQQNIILVLLLYADGMPLTDNNPTTLHAFITTLSAQFAMKDLGDIHYFLGVQVMRTPTGLFLSQHKYVTDLVRKFHFHILKSMQHSMCVLNHIVPG